MKTLRIFLWFMIAFFIGIDLLLFFPLFGLLYGFGFVMVNLFLKIIIFICLYGILYTYNFHNKSYLTNSLAVFCIFLFILTNYLYRKEFNNELKTNGIITEGVVDRIELMKSGYDVIIIFNYNNSEFESTYTINNSLDGIKIYRNALEGKKVKVRHSNKYPRINEVAENLEDYVDLPERNTLFNF
jgi:hypothetical protein